ncbi:hypothetical protein ABMB44_13280 [Levilactobacillus brevis]
MSQNEELAKQILTAYANGQVDLTNVPDLQKNGQRSGRSTNGTYLQHV